MDIPDRFFSGDLEITKSVTKDGMYRFKDQHGNTGYISAKEAEKNNTTILVVDGNHEDFNYSCIWFNLSK